GWKGVERGADDGVRPINQTADEGACESVVSRRTQDDLLRWIERKPYGWRMAIVPGDASLAGLWVNKDDLTYERVLGAVAAVDSDVIGIEAVEAYLNKKTSDPSRAAAAREAYDTV